MASFLKRLRDFFTFDNVLHPKRYLQGNLLHADANTYLLYHDEEMDSDFKTFRESFIRDSLIDGPWVAKMEGVDRCKLPGTRTILVDSQAEYDAAFVTPPRGREYDVEYVFCVPDADFDREIIVIYTEPSLDGDWSVVKKSSVEDGVLKIELDKEKPKKIRGASQEDDYQPFQRYVIIRLDRTEFDKIEVSNAEHL